MTTTSLSVKGMGCGGCVNAIQTALEGIDGVESVSVDLGSATAKVRYDESRTGLPQFSVAVSEAGYSIEQK